MVLRNMKPISKELRKDVNTALSERKARGCPLRTLELEGQGATEKVFRSCAENVDCVILRQEGGQNEVVIRAGDVEREVSSVYTG